MPSNIPVHALPHRENSESFQKHLKTLEEAAYQTLLSLLTAPMQRITKLPLLMNEILKRTPPDDPSRASMEFCLKATEKVFIYYSMYKTIRPVD